MGLPFYKPTPKKTGCLCHFTVSNVTDKYDSKGHVSKKGEKAVFVEFVKQTNWDVKSKTGSFKGGAKANVKFSLIEIAEMILSLRTMKPAFPAPAWKKDAQAGAFHSSPSGTTSIRLEPYEGGMSFQVSQKPKDGERVSFAIGFSKPECVLVGLYLQKCLDKIFDSVYSEDKKRRDITYKNAMEKKNKELDESPVAPPSDETSLEEIL